MIRSHLEYIDWTKNRTIAKHMLTLPSVHLITITVTESGYTSGSPLFEYLACGLRNRKNPITILCCDNIRQNEPNWSLLEPLLREGKFDDFVSSERLWGDIPKNHITFSRDLKTLLMSHTYEKDIDLLGDD